MSLVSNWQKEAARFTPSIRVYVHHGVSRSRAGLDEADLVITTYGTAVRDLSTLGEISWERVVCDEARRSRTAEPVRPRRCT